MTDDRTHPQRRPEPRAAAEAQLRRLSQIADDLLQRADGADALMTERLRAEARRWFAIAFEITHSLARGDIGKAYLLSVGDDVDGTASGMTA